MGVAVLGALALVSSSSGGVAYHVAPAGQGRVWRLPYPEPVSLSITGAVAVAAGWNRAIALRSDGTVLQWSSWWGSPSGSPAAVPGLGDVAAIASGGRHWLALRSDGTVWAWGANDHGQLGSNCTRQGSEVPVQVAGLAGVVGIAAGDDHSLAVRSNGTVWAWGKNSLGQVGDGTRIDRTIPVLIPTILGAAAVAAGGDHSLALLRDGSVRAWGFKLRNELTDPPQIDSSVTPEIIRGLGGVTAIAAGGEHSLALRGDGTVWSWGENWGGQLGDGTFEDRLDPARIMLYPDYWPLDGITSIAAGWGHSLAVKGDGRLWPGVAYPDGTVFAWGARGCSVVALNDCPQDQLHAYGGSAYPAIDIWDCANPRGSWAACQRCVGSYGLCWRPGAVHLKDEPGIFAGVKSVAGGSFTSYALESAPLAPPVITPCDAKLACRAPTLTGTAEPGSAVELLEGGTVVGRATANAARQWEVVAPLGNGSHTLTAVARDPSGTVSPPSAPLTFDVTFDGYTGVQVDRTVIRDATTVGTGSALGEADRLSGKLDARSSVEEKLPAGVWYGSIGAGSVRALVNASVVVDFAVEGCGTFQLATLLGDLSAEVTGESARFGVPFAQAAGAQVEVVAQYFFYPCAVVETCLPSFYATDTVLVAHLGGPTDTPDEVRLRGAVPTPEGYQGPGVVRLVAGLHTDALISGAGLATAHAVATFLACLL
jgi:alpha-tubulin suppressor-like RCC1 family protein